MKSVFNNDGVAEQFLLQLLPGARNAKRSFYFEGKTLYSYGPHFVVARFLLDNYTLYVSTRSTSLSTSGHQSSLRRHAWRHRARIHEVQVYDAAEAGEKELEYRLLLVKRAEDHARARIKRPRNAAKWLWHREACASYAVLCAHNLGLPAPTIPDLPEDLLTLKAICQLRNYKT